MYIYLSPIHCLHMLNTPNIIVKVNDLNAYNAFDLRHMLNTFQDLHILNNLNSLATHKNL